MVPKKRILSLTNIKIKDEQIKVQKVFSEMSKISIFHTRVNCQAVKIFVKRKHKAVRGFKTS